MTTLALLLFVACLGSFAWARRYFFARTPQTKKGRRGLGPLGTAFGLSDLALLVFGGGSLNGVAAWMALGVLAGALGVFWCSVAAFEGRRPSIAHTPGAPERLITIGPYRMVRHPFYLAYILSWVGCFAANPNIFTFIPIPVMTFLYVRAAMEEERSIMTSQLGAQYVEYMQETGMFFPKLSKILRGNI